MSAPLGSGATRPALPPRGAPQRPGRPLRRRGRHLAARIAKSDRAARTPRRRVLVQAAAGTFGAGRAQQRSGDPARQAARTAVKASSWTSRLGPGGHSATVPSSRSRPGRPTSTIVTGLRISAATPSELTRTLAAPVSRRLRAYSQRGTSGSTATSATGSGDSARIGVGPPVTAESWAVTREVAPDDPVAGTDLLSPGLQCDRTLVRPHELEESYG